MAADNRCAELSMVQAFLIEERALPSIVVLRECVVHRMVAECREGQRHSPVALQARVAVQRSATVEEPRRSSIETRTTRETALTTVSIRGEITIAETHRLARAVRAVADSRAAAVAATEAVIRWDDRFEGAQWSGLYQC